MKLVREHIYEKFEEESDPIHDMGIGGYSFETLKPGAILRAKRFFGVSKTGKFGGIRNMYNIWTGNYLLVIKVMPSVKPNNKYIEWFNCFNSNDMAKVYRENFIKDSRYFSIKTHHRHGVFNDISKRQFDYRLEIIKGGF